MLCASFTLFPAQALNAQSVSFEMDLSGANATPISPLIYGLNDWSRDSATASINFTLERQGGNRMSGYNWENNASNAGSDYIHHSDNLLVNTLPSAQQSLPGAAVKLSVDHARGAGRPSLVTLQLAGYVAADKNGTVTEAQKAPSSRWKQVVVNKGSAYTLTPSTSDAYVYLDEQVNFLIQTYGTASEGGVFAYSLDNEPALWSHTHPRIHPNKAGVAEIIERGAEAAAMVKRLDLDALVFGPALWGWGAYQNFSDAPDWSSFSGSYDWFISAYLAGMKARSDSAGRRLLDVLDIHYYPEAAAVTGQDSGGNDVYTRVTDSSSNNEALTQERLQAPRSLWDPTHTEQSWVSTWITRGPLRLFSRVFPSIDTHYPDTKLAITEYDYGGHQNYSGGLAQADVLGIYGKYGVYAACFWGNVEGYIIPAFKLYRDYDGQGATFGNIAFPVSNPAPESYSSYLSTDAERGSIHLVLINKTGTASSISVGQSGGRLAFEKAKVYGFDSANGASLRQYDDVQDMGLGGFSYTLPACSALHFVIEQPALGSEELRVERSQVAGKLCLLFKGRSGHRYQLQHSSDLAEWTDIGEELTGSGLVTYSEQAMPANEQPGFWRYKKLSGVE